MLKKVNIASSCEDEDTKILLFVLQKQPGNKKEKKEKKKKRMNFFFELEDPMVSTKSFI